MKKRRGSAWAPLLDRVRAQLRDGGACPTLPELLGNVWGVSNASSRKGKLQRNPAKKTTPLSYQRVVMRRPVPFQPDPKNPKYLLCYVRETLECGHTLDVFPGELEPLIARRRNCHKCSGWHGALKLPKKRRAA